MLQPAPDQFFDAQQIQRLAELMGRWRAARDRGETLPPCEQAELNELVEAEIRATAARCAMLLENGGLAPPIDGADQQ
jgi:hypothetical protein